MEHHIDPFEQLARWILLVTTTALLVAVAAAIALGRVTYWATGVTSTAFYMMARLARVLPGDDGTFKALRRSTPKK